MYERRAQASAIVARVAILAVSTILCASKPVSSWRESSSTTGLYAGKSTESARRLSPATAMGATIVTSTTGNAGTAGSLCTGKKVTERSSSKSPTVDWKRSSGFRTKTIPFEAP